MADLQRRLVPTGLRSNVETTSRLHLGNLLGSRLVRLGPLACLDANPEPTPLRTREVTLTHHDGRAKATTFGVSVHKKVQASSGPAWVNSPAEHFPAPRRCACMHGHSTRRRNCTFQKKPWELGTPPHDGTGQQAAAWLSRES